MTYRTADAAVARWWELATTVRVPQAIDTVERRGILFAARCPNPRCGHTGHRLVENYRGERAERCERCSWEWPAIEVEELKQPRWPGTPMVPRPPRALEELADLEGILSRAFTRTEGAVMLLWARPRKTKLRPDDLAELVASQAFLHGLLDWDGSRWTPDRVRAAVRVCRRSYETQLERIEAAQWAAFTRARQGRDRSAGRLRARATA